MTPTTNEITKEQATTLANLIEQIRPDWPTRQVLKLIAEHRTEHTFGHLCQAAVSAASKRSNRSPNVIFMPGTHWDIEEHKAPIPKAPACEDHPTFEAHNCRCCWSDVKVGDRPENMIGKHLPTPAPAEPYATQPETTPADDRTPHRG